MVRWVEDEVAIAIGQESYLLFKLTVQGEEGRRVKSPSSGSYLAIVPEDWERDEVLSGIAPYAGAFHSSHWRTPFSGVLYQSRPGSINPK